jgi:hypothetical protein
VLEEQVIKQFLAVDASLKRAQVLQTLHEVLSEVDWTNNKVLL